MHYMYCKIKEWGNLKLFSFEDLIKKLIENYKTYLPGEEVQNIINWCHIYE